MVELDLDLEVLEEDEVADRLATILCLRRQAWMPGVVVEVEAAEEEVFQEAEVVLCRCSNPRPLRNYVG